MATNYLYTICVSCKGTGEHPKHKLDEEGNPIPDGMKECDKCKGEGSYLWGTLEDELREEE